MKVKDRELTEKMLLSAIGEIISKDGFDKIGVNAVAAKAGVSKVLIYRYFESIENLTITYLSQSDFWINFSPEFPQDNKVGEFLKNMFREQISQLRKNKVLKEMQRWELSTNNSIIEKLRIKRETKSAILITMVSQLTKHPQKEIAVMATLISASISYLVLLEDNCPVYNGFDLQNNSGWEELSSGIDFLIDKWFEIK